MSNDAIVKKEKKEKKPKKEKAPTENVDMNSKQPELPKKKGKKLDETQPTAPDPGKDVMVVDAEEDANKKKKKSKNKKKAEAIAQDDHNAMLIDSEAEPQKKKEKRKNKSSAQPQVSTNSSETPIELESREKKTNKKKRKHEEENTTDVPSSKKDNKKRKKEEKESSISTSTPAESPAPSTLKATPALASTSASAPSSTPAQTSAFLEKHSITIHTPTGAPPVTPIINFPQLSNYNVPAELQTSFKGFKEPTPIQACTWPPALEGKDIVGIAETGSGKTLAFGIPALVRLLSNPPPTKSGSNTTITTLVVAPTRELAIQTHDTLSALGKQFGIASVAVFGGVPKEPQVKMLRNANKAKDGLTTRIIVGTPGRILDLMQEGACDLSEVNYLVLDEADRMLDKGFENDIRNIISSTKSAAERQTMMFSATWPEAVRRLAASFQRDPIRVTVGSDDLTANSRVEQRVEVFDDARSKDQRLLNELKSLALKKNATKGLDESRILVFALYKKEASRVEQMLLRQGYSVGALHGDMSQSARMEALERFKNGTTNLMVATDVAARGLDIPNVGAVINYTFPLTIEDYIHRIGRTGRGGKTGKSITFFTGDQHERALAGEFARVLNEGGFDYEALKKFPMSIKKKEHSAYGAFFRNDIPVPKGPTKIVF